MKKTRIHFALPCILISLLMLMSACSSTGAQPSATASPAAAAAGKSEAKTRVITDLTGAKVEIPVSSNIKKVVIVAPPLVATYASVLKDTSKLVGMHQQAIQFANPEILKIVVPNSDQISTSFLSGYTSNAEEVMKLNPDIILVYGESQKKGLENVKIPVVDFFITDMDNESWSVKIDDLMREIFEKDKQSSLAKEWQDAKAAVSTTLDKSAKETKKTAIMIFSNTGDKITVRGAGSYGDDWLKKTGLTNAAGELKGDNLEVSMEQLLKWNPDIIYDFKGKDASAYLSNSIKGQDWSQIKAYKNGAIYDMPCGMFNWGAPNVDSPLTLIWMTMKNYPGTIEESYFNNYMKAYYQRQYGIALSDTLLGSILDPVK